MTKQAATFCDLDETLYPRTTLRDASRWLLAHHELPASSSLKVLYWFTLRRLGILNHEQAFQEGIRFLAGRKLADVEQLMARIYREVLRDNFIPNVRDLLAEWRRHGQLVIATESLTIIAAPIAADLAFDAIIGTELEVVDGLLTGRLAGPVLRGETKAHAVRRWAAENHVDLARSAAVGGRRDDAALLKIVGHGIMIDPDAAASQLAAEHGWDIIRTV